MHPLPHSPSSCWARFVVFDRPPSEHSEPTSHGISTSHPSLPPHLRASSPLELFSSFSPPPPAPNQPSRLSITKLGQHSMGTDLKHEITHRIRRKTQPTTGVTVCKARQGKASRSVCRRVTSALCCLLHVCVSLSLPFSLAFHGWALPCRACCARDCLGKPTVSPKPPCR